MELEEQANMDSGRVERELQLFQAMSGHQPTEGDNQVQVEQLTPAALAYLGDAVYELYVRTYYLTPPKRLHLYHQQVVAQVRAENQARHLRSLQPHLTDVEKDVLRRGRNAASRGPKRLDPAVYQEATSLEALLGYLYITNPPRLAQLLNHLQQEFAHTQIV